MILSISIEIGRRGPQPGKIMNTVLNEVYASACVVMLGITHTCTAQNTDCGYSLEPPLIGGSKEYPQSMF